MPTINAIQALGLLKEGIDISSCGGLPFVEEMALRRRAWALPKPWASNRKEMLRLFQRSLVHIGGDSTL